MNPLARQVAGQHSRTPLQAAVMRLALRCALTLALAAALPMGEAIGADAPAKRTRVGLLALGPPATTSAEAVGKALQDLGYVDGKNVVLEYRFADYQQERLPALAAELSD